MNRDIDENLDQPSDANAETDASLVSDADIELEKLKAERDGLFEKLARAQADFQNSRRRLETDAEQRLHFANANLIKALLPVIDNFDRALSVDSSKSDASSVLKGLALVNEQLHGILKSQHVELIAPEPGTPFDPALHEALLQQPSDDYTEPTVTQLLTKGYALKGRTLRPAQVAVSAST